MGIFGAAASMAQVYSQNAVGFYTLSLGPGFNLVANQLNNGDNNVNTLMPPTTALPEGASLLTWNVGLQKFNDADAWFAGYGWYDADLNPSSTVLEAGGGAFIQMPPGQNASVVLVGEVPQGSLTTQVSPGFQIISQLTPQAIGLETTGFPAAEGDSLLFWDAGLQKYEDALAYFAGYGWVDADLNIVDPTAEIGEAMFYQRGETAGTADWNRDFSVNP